MPALGMASAAVAVLIGMSPVAPGSGSAESELAQIGFRVRADFGAALNADQGWAGAYNEEVAVAADQPFRIRFEVEGSGAEGGSRQFRLQVRRNGGPWEDLEAHDFPKPEEASPRVSLVSSSGFADGEPTADLLGGSGRVFRGGAGLGLAAVTPLWPDGNVHSEWEWPLVIRRFADGPVTNEQGDTFEFRMVEADGTPFGSYRVPVLRLIVPPRHVGGTFVETPGRIGPWQASNGDLYFIMEPTETDNKLMMVKSTDHGSTWAEVDGANRPPTRDLEGVASVQAGSTIHIIHQPSAVRYHSFRTSDHPTHADRWEVRGEDVASPGSPPTQVTTVAVRTDGSVVALYGGPQKVHLRIRSHLGAWGAERVIDEDLSPNLSGPVAVRGQSDVVHFAYTGADGTGWYRRLLPDGTLTPRQQIATGLGTQAAERIAILPLVFIPETNTVVIVYRLATGTLWERRIIADAEPTPAVLVTDRTVVTNAVDSHQAGADLVADGEILHVLFIEQGSGSIFSTRSDRPGHWRPATLEVDGIRGSWIRGEMHTRPDGARVLGYIYDAGSGGGAGMNRFAEVPASR
jgi:hypothetical protein